MTSLQKLLDSYRQAAATYQDSGIVNDENDWAVGTRGNPRYPLELFMRVVTESLETMEIVNGLPRLEILENGSSGFVS